MEFRRNARLVALCAGFGLLGGCGGDEVEPNFTTGGPTQGDGLEAGEEESSSTDEGATAEGADQGDGDGDAGDGDGTTVTSGDGTTGDGDGTTGDGDGTTGDGDGTIGDGDGTTGDGTTGDGDGDGTSTTSTTGPVCTTGDGDGDGDGDGTQGASYAPCVADSDCPNQGEVCVNWLNPAVSSFCSVTCASAANCNPEPPGGSIGVSCDFNIGVLKGDFNSYCAVMGCQLLIPYQQSNCPDCMVCTNAVTGVVYCGHPA